jgi:hypothetical protein
VTSLHSPARVARLQQLHSGPGGPRYLGGSLGCRVTLMVPDSGRLTVTGRDIRVIIPDLGSSTAATATESLSRQSLALSGAAPRPQATRPSRSPAPGHWCHGVVSHLGSESWPSGRTLRHIDLFTGEGSLVDCSPAVLTEAVSLPRRDICAKWR